MRLDAHQRHRVVVGAVLSFVLLTAVKDVSTAGAERETHVLLVYDEDKTLPGLAILDRSLRSTIGAERGAQVEFFTESMNASQFRDDRDEQVLRNYYQQKYRDRQPDLIIGVMGPSLRFLLRHGAELFPGVPIVFCGADRADIDGRALPDTVTGVLVKRVFAPTVDVMLRLQPETQQVVVVGGTSPFDRHLMAQARSELKSFEKRVSFRYLTEASMDDILSTASRLPPRSTILFVTLFRDATGKSFVPHDAVARLSREANAPVYVVVDQYLGRGPVGGHLYSLEQHGNRAAEIGLRVLRGEAPSSIPVRELVSTANMFDARQLARWRLDERRLPDNSTVLFREPTLWGRYKTSIVAVAMILVAQATLIGALVLQRARRRRVESKLRRSYRHIRRLGRRLLRAHEDERAHLARELHDDVAQKMTVVQLDLRTLMCRSAVGWTQDDESLLGETESLAGEIGRSLRDLSHRLHPGHICQIGLPAALDSLQREWSASDVRIAISNEDVPKSLPAEVVLCMYRVAQEALSNSVTHGGAKSIAIRLFRTHDGIRMTIRDNGGGFDVRIASRGLGLISMRERVQQVGGRLHIHSESGQGTALDVTVPHQEPRRRLLAG